MYKPNPIDTSSIILCDSLYGLMENIASQLHEIWAINCVSEGWVYDQSFDESNKKNLVLFRIQNFMNTTRNMTATMLQKL